jgi:hypothetical protein
MKIDFYIPSSETVPTHLRLLVDGKYRVQYKRSEGELAYEFTVFDVEDPAQSLSIVRELASAMCKQSYDYDSVWGQTDLVALDPWSFGGTTYKVRFQNKYNY